MVLIVTLDRREPALQGRKYAGNVVMSFTLEVGTSAEDGIFPALRQAWLITSWRQTKIVQTRKRLFYIWLG